MRTLSVSKRSAQKLYMERFRLKKLNKVDVMEQYQFKIQTGLQLWRIQMMGLQKILETISNSQLKESWSICTEAA